MNYRPEITIIKLMTTGIVPIDEVFALTAEGIDFSGLDEQYNTLN